MLCTNTKKVREAIRNYITTNFDYDNFEIEERTFENAQKKTRDSFLNWLSPYELRLHKTYQNAFISWSQGLPCGLFDYWLYKDDTNPINILGDILEETEEERNRHTMEDAAKLLTYLIYREINRVIL